MIFFEIKVNACILLHPISNKILIREGGHFKYFFTYIAKKIGKNIAVQTMRWNFPTWHVGKEH